MAPPIPAEAATEIGMDETSVRRLALGGMAVLAVGLVILVGGIVLAISGTLRATRADHLTAKCLDKVEESTQQTERCIQGLGTQGVYKGQPL